MSGENTPMSKKGKFSVQNWQSDPMNSPKAFGELKKKASAKEKYSGFLKGAKCQNIGLFFSDLCDFASIETTYPNKQMRKRKPIT